MRHTITFILFLTFGNFLNAQDNVFLDANFWKTNPSVETIDQKIKEGNDIAEANASNFDGVAQAILQGAPNPTIEYAISKEGNDVNKITHDQRTYIFWAAYKGNLPLVKFLLEKGAKTDITDNKGNTILNFAAGAGQENTEIYDLLLAHGANLNKDLTPSGANALLLAATHDTDFKLIDYFTSQGLDLKSVDNHGNGIFNYTAKKGNIDFLKQLVKKGITGNGNAFIFASQGIRGHANGLEVYKYLESLGLKPNTVNDQGTNALHALAYRSKDLDVINYFLKKGTDVNQQDEAGNTPFLNAANRNSLDILKLLSSHLKDINLTNKKGESALSLAVAHNSPEVVAFLLKLKADATVVDAQGNDLTAYLMQSYTSKEEKNFNAKLELLKKHGLVFGKPQGNGNTLYHLALETNNLDIVKFVNQFNADINAKNNKGLTPLHMAAMRAQNTEILKYLLSVGAKKTIITNFDETAYDLAVENELLTKQKASLEFLQ